MNTYTYYLVCGLRIASPTQAPSSRSPSGRTQRGGEHPGEQRPVPDGICVGSPDRIIEAVKVWESIGVDAINFILNATEMLPQEQVLASLRLFASEVMAKC